MPRRASAFRVILPRLSEVPRGMGLAVARTGAAVCAGLGGYVKTGGTFSMKRPEMKRAAVAMSVFALVVFGASAASADVCTGRKIKAICKKEKRLLACSAKEATKGTAAVQPACNMKASDKFTTAYNKPSGCTTPVATQCESIADDCQAKLRAALPDGDGTTPSRCEAARLKAAGKKAAAKLGCYAKAAARDVAVDPDCLI